MITKWHIFMALSVDVMGPRCLRKVLHTVNMWWSSSQIQKFQITTAKLQLHLHKYLNVSYIMQQYHKLT